jgi:CBS domain-containing protein
MVSEADLMRRAAGEQSQHWCRVLFANRNTQFVRTYGTRARDVMTREVVSIGGEATLADIAGILESRGIKRLPVVEAGRLVGIVSRADVLRGLASLKAADIQPGAGDLAIRKEILEMAKGEFMHMH